VKDLRKLAYQFFRPQDPSAAQPLAVPLAGIARRAGQGEQIGIISDNVGGFCVDGEFDELGIGRIAGERERRAGLPVVLAEIPELAKQSLNLECRDGWIARPQVNQDPTVFIEKRFAEDGNRLSTIDRPTADPRADRPCLRAAPSTNSPVREGSWYRLR
jgi:hypothetical protein